MGNSGTTTVIEDVLRRFIYHTENQMIKPLLFGEMIEGEPEDVIGSEVPGPLVISLRRVTTH